MSSPRIRPFEDTDTAGAARALVSVHTTDGYPVEGVGRPIAWIRSPDVLSAWVAEADGEIVGHVAVMRSRGEDAVRLWQRWSGTDASTIAVLARLFVVREARGDSVGEHLTRTAMEYAQREKLRLVLDVMTKDTAAIRLYERLGWQKIGRADHRYGDDQRMAALCYVSPDAGPR